MRKSTRILASIWLLLGGVGVCIAARLLRLLAGAGEAGETAGYLAMMVAAFGVLWAVPVLVGATGLLCRRPWGWWVLVVYAFLSTLPAAIAVFGTFLWAVKAGRYYGAHGGGSLGVPIYLTVAFGVLLLAIYTGVALLRDRPDTWTQPVDEPTAESPKPRQVMEREVRDQLRREIAYHEAGHALVAWCQGRELDQVAILPGIDPYGWESAGYCHRQRSETCSDLAANSPSQVELWLLQAQDAVAGMAGVEQASGESPWSRADPLRELGSEGDQQRFSEAALALVGDHQEARELLLRWAYAAARGVLTRYRPALDALVDALLERGCIPGAVARSIIDAASSE